MISWLTGSRITDVAQDLEPLDATYLEAPETPAPLFAVRAFKHAVFGTPQPEERDHVERGKRGSNELKNARGAQSVPAQSDFESSPTKRSGILKTPGTISKGKKTINWGSQVIDNEGKKSVIPGKSGLPNDFPGKFPSPWTPRVEAGRENEPQRQAIREQNRAEHSRSQSTLAPRVAREPPSQQDNSNTRLVPPSPAKLRTRDDADITLDMQSPRSESGRYWKEAYETYAANSEREVRKLIKKQQLAKNFARKKNAEVTELTQRLTDQKAKYARRQQKLEEQMHDYKEKLRQQIAENNSLKIEIALMRKAAEKDKASKSVERKEKPTKQITPPNSKRDFLTVHEDVESSHTPTGSPLALSKVEYEPDKVVSTLLEQEQEQRPTLKDRSPSTGTVPLRASNKASRLPTAPALSSASKTSSPSIVAPKVNTSALPTPTALKSSKFDTELDIPVPTPITATKISASDPPSSHHPWMLSSPISTFVHDKMAMPIGIGGGATAPLATRKRAHTATQTRRTERRTERREKETLTTRTSDKGNDGLRRAQSARTPPRKALLEEKTIHTPNLSASTKAAKTAQTDAMPEKIAAPAKVDKENMPPTQAAEGFTEKDHRDNNEDEYKKAARARLEARRRARKQGEKTQV